MCQLEEGRAGPGMQGDVGGQAEGRGELVGSGTGGGVPCQF